MVPDLGPKNGDFASYVESLGRQQSHSVGHTHTAAPAAHVDAPDDADTGPAPRSSHDLSAPSGMPGALHDPGPDSAFHASDKLWNSIRPEASALAFTAASRSAKSAVRDLLHAGRWVLRIVGLILIITGIFAVPIAVIPIVFGATFLSLSFRQAGSGGDHGS